jgi:ABC-2 type transport system permease protein
MNLANIRAVFLKEVRILVRSPLLYVLGAVFLGLAGYFFYTDVLYFDLLNQDKIGLTQGLWQRFFEDLRFCLLLVIPVLASRVFAEERRLGTMEMLQTYPLAESEIVSGKALSLIVVFVPLVLTTAFYPFVLSYLWPVDPWPLIATYVGVLLLSLACLSCGMLCSALATQQSSAAIATFGIMFVSWFLAWNEAAASAEVLAVLRRLSLFDRFYDFTRGTVQSKDVVYFLVVSGLLLLGAWEVLRWQWRSRRKQVVWVLLLIGLGVGIETYAVRYNRTWELVQERESLLAPETLQALAAITVPVKLLLFYEAGRYRETAYLAEKCRSASSFLEVQLIDLDRELGMAKSYGVTTYGTVVIESAEHRETVYPAEERLLVQAINRVIDPKPRIVCVTTGHGEREITIERKREDDEPTSVAKLFEHLGYQWREVVLEGAQADLQECRLVFVYGPTQDLNEQNTKHIAKFVDDGGSLLLLLEPGSFPQLGRLLEQYQISLGEEISPDAPDQLYLRDHATVPIVDVALAKRLPEQFTAVFYGARQLNFVASQPESNGGVFLGYRSSTRGVVPVGVAAETTSALPGRIMVVGDADFLHGALFERKSNRQLFARMLGWLATRTDRHPPTQERYAYAPLSVRQSRMLLWIALSPAFVFLLAGILAWWRRRVA